MRIELESLYKQQYIHFFSTHTKCHVLLKGQVLSQGKFTQGKNDSL